MVGSNKTFFQTVYISSNKIGSLRYSPIYFHRISLARGVFRNLLNKYDGAFYKDILQLKPLILLTKGSM